MFCFWVHDVCVTASLSHPGVAFCPFAYSPIQVHSMCPNQLSESAVFYLWIQHETRLQVSRLFVYRCFVKFLVVKPENPFTPLYNMNFLSNDNYNPHMYWIGGGSRGEFLGMDSGKITMTVIISNGSWSWKFLLFWNCVFEYFNNTARFSDWSRKNKTIFSHQGYQKSYNHSLLTDNVRTYTLYAELLRNSACYASLALLLSPFKFTTTDFTFHK